MISDSSFEWYHVHAWLTSLQAIVGAPLWYQVYVVAESPDVLAERLTAAFAALPSVALGAIVLVMVLSLLGPPVAAGLGYESLRRRHAEPSWAWLVLAFGGMHLWPLQFLAVWEHRRETLACSELDDREWRYEVGSS